MRFANSSELFLSKELDFNQHSMSVSEG